MAYLEILEECTAKIGCIDGNEKNFNSMFDYATGKIILSLVDIPEDCSIILVSEYIPEEFESMNL